MDSLQIVRINNFKIPDLKCHDISGACITPETRINRGVELLSSVAETDCRKDQFDEFPPKTNIMKPGKETFYKRP